MNKVCYVAPSPLREPIKMQSAILKVTFPNHSRDLTEIGRDLESRLRQFYCTIYCSLYINKNKEFHACF